MLSTVLIIDKRKELSVKYKKSIDSTETKAIIAGNMKDAFSLVQNLEPDMIIISDSIEENLAAFCKKIRTLTYNTRPIIVALSKSADSSDRINVIENGADDFWSEPVNIEEFKTRIQAHLRRDIELNLDSKTLLPSGKLVDKAMKRILSSENQAILIAGIENLKDYTEVYTELAADKLIQTFVAIAKSAIDEKDFIGRLDENNFIIITNKYSAEKLASFLTFAFDTVAPRFYSETDAKRGYMLLNGERYAGMRSEFVSLLVGGIIDGLNTITRPDVLKARLINIKKMAKLPNGSNYAIERPQITAQDSVVAPVVNKNIYIMEKDDSLNYLIRTALELQGYEIENNIDIQSAEQPSIIILDSGEGLETLELLRKMKMAQNFVNTKFIVTTTTHDKSVILDSGADLYLPKPYEISDLIRWIEYFIKSRIE